MRICWLCDGGAGDDDAERPSDLLRNCRAMSNTPTASLGGETNGGDLERIKKLCPPTRMARHGICRRQIQQHIAMSLILVCLHGVEIALPEGIEKRFGTHRAMRRNLSGNPPRESRFHTIDGGFAGVAPSCVWLEGRGAERNRISRMRLQLRGGQDAQAAGPHPSNPSPLSSSCSCFSSVELPILCLPRFTYPTVAVLLPHVTTECLARSLARSITHSHASSRFLPPILCILFEEQDKPSSRSVTKASGGCSRQHRSAPRLHLWWQCCCFCWKLHTNR